MITTRSISCAFVCAIVFVACGDDGAGVPQPVPIPNQSLLRGGFNEEADTIRMVGLPGAVAGAGDVILDAGRGEVIVRSSPAGSFVASVANDGNVVSVRFETSEPVSYAVSLAMIIPTITPAESIENTPIEVPVDGKTTIIGTTAANVEVFAVNLRSADVAVGTADDQGLFTLELPAQSGDKVEVYAYEDAMSDPWTLTVP